MLPRHLF
ncbi:hypothetical protein LEMLEM_LOCUS17415 [Lemmus lemmus]